MKFIQIFLLVLIVIGVGLIVTQKWWVPKIVQMMLEEEAAREVSLAGELCFTYKHAATSEEPYEVEEHITIGIQKGKVTGTKEGTQAGPDMTNGYQGTLAGEKKEERLELVFSYVIEGSPNKELEIYKIEKDALAKMRWALKEEGGMLVPDKVGEPKLLIYNQVQCESVAIENNIVSEPAAIVIVPSDERIDNLKARYGEEDFYIFADDSMFFLNEAENFLKEKVLPRVQRRSEGSIKFKLSSGVIVEESLSKYDWAILLFNGKTAPVQVDYTDIQPAYEKVFGK